MWCAKIKRTTRLAHRSRRKVGGTRDGGSGRCISGTTFFQLYFSGYWYLIETLCSVTPLGHAPLFHLSVLLLADCFSSQRRRVSRHWCLSISIWNHSLSRNLSGCRLVILVEFFFLEHQQRGYFGKFQYFLAFRMSLLSKDHKAYERGKPYLLSW